MNVKCTSILSNLKYDIITLLDALFYDTLNILKNKSNFTLLLYIHFLGSGILNVLNSYQSSINYLLDSWILCFCCHKCNRNVLIKESRGHAKLFQNASLLMWCCSFVIGKFLTLKNQSEKQAVELLLTVQISADHPSCNNK